jgi:hypothetical protein
MTPKPVGFDRKIQLDWLNATADWAAQGLAATDIRARLQRLLEGSVAGAGSHSARGKTTTVLMHVWVRTPDTATPLRRDGLDLLQGRSGRARLPLHWGMCLATYPFFADVVAVVGRLLSLQPTFTQSQVTRRITEGWGDRSTVVRATQRVLRSLVDWQVIGEPTTRGPFAPCKTIPLSNEDGLCTWLLEAAILGTGRTARPFAGLVGSPVFFPFRLSIRPGDVARNKRLELHRQGMDEDLVLRKQVPVPGKARRDTQLRLI